MTTTQTLLPNGTRSGAGDFTVTGAALIHVCCREMQRYCLGANGTFPDMTP